AVENGGIGQVKYTLVADMTHAICKAYDVESEGGVAFRGAFIIDQNGDVRSQIVNDLPLGRNMDELIRLFEALQYHEEHGEVCPAGWSKGDKGMDASPEGVAAYLTAESDKL
ncbi:MAG: redoxin domain-containing protein, partial [Pseudomonadales bacterium]|nr:redoxin domain-containing protein [Pseudomonadales bacterium]